MSQNRSRGYQGSNWILMDYQDVIVHIFDNENRLFYDLERIWRDGKKPDGGRTVKIICTEVTSIFL